MTDILTAAFAVIGSVSALILVLLLSVCAYVAMMRYWFRWYIVASRCPGSFVPMSPIDGGGTEVLVDRSYPWPYHKDLRDATLWERARARRFV